MHMRFTCLVIFLVLAVMVGWVPVLLYVANPYLLAEQERLVAFLQHRHVETRSVYIPLLGRLEPEPLSLQIKIPTTNNTLLTSYYAYVNILNLREEEARPVVELPYFQRLHEILRWRLSTGVHIPRAEEVREYFRGLVNSIRAAVHRLSTRVRIPDVEAVRGYFRSLVNSIRVAVHRLSTRVCLPDVEVVRGYFRSLVNYFTREVVTGPVEQVAPVGQVDPVKVKARKDEEDEEVYVEVEEEGSAEVEVSEVTTVEEPEVEDKEPEVKETEPEVEYSVLEAWLMGMTFPYV
ncbi:uncharacterized protein [Panulirus ornatus]|uniref:uncharacterized protein n=1 Tax=Panulirus ornatus TaxID=150431 RepID=UPI003A8B6AC5